MSVARVDTTVTLLPAPQAPDNVIVSTRYGPAWRTELAIESAALGYAANATSVTDSQGQPRLRVSFPVTGQHTDGVIDATHCHNPFTGHGIAARGRWPQAAYEVWMEYTLVVPLGWFPADLGKLPAISRVPDGESLYSRMTGAGTTYFPNSCWAGLTWMGPSVRTGDYTSTTYPTGNATQRRVGAFINGWSAYSAPGTDITREGTEQNPNPGLNRIWPDQFAPRAVNNPNPNNPFDSSAATGGFFFLDHNPAGESRNTIRIYAKANTTNTEDGIFQVYVINPANPTPGRRVLDLRKICYTLTRLPFNVTFHDMFYGGPKSQPSDQIAYLEDLTIQSVPWDS